MVEPIRTRSAQRREEGLQAMPARSLTQQEQVCVFLRLCYPQYGRFRFFLCVSFFKPEYLFTRLQHVLLEREDATLRQLRMYLRECLGALIRDRKFKAFRNSGL